jgi:acetamidase/formamidase
MGLDEDLHEATTIALDAMLDVMVERHDMERKYALALASVVVDFRITQIANQTLGVHAILEDGALTP